VAELSLMFTLKHDFGWLPKTISHLQFFAIWLSFFRGSKSPSRSSANSNENAYSMTHSFLGIE
jgi:hypothetical protein